MSYLLSIFRSGHWYGDPFPNGPVTVPTAATTTWSWTWLWGRWWRKQWQRWESQSPRCEGLPVEEGFFSAKPVRGHHAMFTKGPLNPATMFTKGPLNHLLQQQHQQQPAGEVIGSGNSAADQIETRQANTHRRPDSQFRAAPGCEALATTQRQSRANVTATSPPSMPRRAHTSLDDAMSDLLPSSASPSSLTPLGFPCAGSVTSLRAPRQDAVLSVTSGWVTIGLRGP